MASWAAPIALTGFNYSGVSKTMKFKAIEGMYFWSNGYSYGTIEIKSKSSKYDIRIKTLGGKLELKSFELRDKGSKDFENVQVIEEGAEVSIIITG